MKHRNEFTQYLQSKGFAKASIAIYTYPIKVFFKQSDKELTQITKADILKHLEHLKKQKGLQNVSRKMHLTGLNHYFTFLCEREEIAENPCSLLKIRGANKISLYKTFTGEQLTELYDSYYTLFVKNYDYSRTPMNRLEQVKVCRQRNAAILSILLNQGTATKEIDRLLIQDIDLQKATIKIRGGKRSNERNLNLKAEQIGLLIHYQNEIRPQFLTDATAESEKLFLPYPTKGNREAANPESLMDLFKPLTNQVKKVEPKFLNFKQVRASVIIHWLKIHGLRKTQYMAGHRYIRGTEYYLRGSLEDLTNDISKHHPF